MEKYKYEVGDTVVISAKSCCGLVVCIKQSDGRVNYLVETDDMSRSWYAEDEISRLTSIKGRDEMRAFVEHYLGLNIQSIARILNTVDVTYNSLELSFSHQTNEYQVCHTVKYKP
jgi:hypothetical protein